MFTRPGSTVPLIKRITALVLLILFCVANSGYFCPLGVVRKGGINCFVFLVYDPDMIGYETVVIKLPLFASWLGFIYDLLGGSENRALQGRGAPQGGEPVLVGVFSFDTTNDGFPEDTQNILAPSIFEAFVDANDNGAFDAASEIRMVFSGLDNAITITNPAGGTLVPMGYYSFTFFSPLLFLFGAAEFGVSASVDDVEVEVTRFAWANTSVLPHVPFGEVRAPAGGELLLSVLTEMVLINAQDQPQDAVIRFRSAATGEMQEVTIEGETASSHTIPVPANTSRLIRIDPTDVDLDVTWATVTGFGPLGVASNFVSLTPGPASVPAGFAAAQIDAQAGIGAADLDIKHVVNVEKTADGIHTALAVLNVTSATATVKLSLFEDASPAPAGPGPAGSPAGAGNPFAEAELILDPNTQVARFFDQLFGIGPDSFSGTLILESDAELAVTSLRTIDMKQASSLPSGTPTPR